jgi:hypothetical protein
MEERTILCRTVFGSKLYGTDTPESDTDYKSVFMPTAREILTGQIPKTINITTGKNNSRNGADDVDHESFSLHYFMQLLYQGQTVALDMLHGNKEEISTPIWKYLKTHRHEFYTKNMKAFVGYARKQAAKYGVKGSRLDAAREALAFLMTKGDTTIGELHRCGALWSGEHTYIHLEWPNTNLTTFPDQQKSYWEVCGKKMTFGGKASHYVDMLKKFYDNYGGRAKLAAANEGIDWKAISHAFRVAFQTQMILSGDGFKYPLPQTEYLRKVKAGKLDYTTEVAPYLDSLMDVIEAQSQYSDLPDKVKVERWQNWLTAMTLDHIKKEVLGNVKC